MYLCVEDIGFTKNRYIQHTKSEKEVNPISSKQKYIEKGKADIFKTQIHRKR
jgi:hypothetical protein